MHEPLTLPIYIDSFVAPIRDNTVAQVAVVGVLLLILLDIVFGVINALCQHKYSSAKMRSGLGHKCAELGLLMVGIIADGMLLGGFDLPIAPVFLVICGGLFVMELGSILEIYAQMNPDIARLKAFKLLESVKEGDHGDSE